MIRASFFVAQGLLAFLPALLVLLIARADPDRAGEFSVTMGVVGTIFSIAYFGQRAYVAVRGFDSVACREAVAFRACMSILAACLTLLATYGMGLTLGIALFAIGLKLSESIIDLWVGIRIRLTSDRQSSFAYLGLAGARAVLVAVPLLWLGTDAAVASSWAPAYLFLLAACAYLFAHFDTRRLGMQGSYHISPRKILRVGWEMRSFVSATAVCALLSSLPRVILPYSEGGSYSAAALALSIVPIFGLGLQALWLGRLKRMAAQGAAQVQLFVVEVGALVLGCALLWRAWEWLGAVVYNLTEPAQQSEFAKMLCAGVLLSGAVCLSNLFKLTPRPRYESLTYAIGLALLLGLIGLGGCSAAVSMSGSAIGMTAFLWLVYRPFLRPRLAGQALQS